MIIPADDLLTNPIVVGQCRYVITMLPKYDGCLYGAMAFCMLWHQWCRR